MGKKGSGSRVTIHLECTTCRTSGVPGVSRYSFRKNKKKGGGTRMELKKYCPFERKHTVHKEIR